MRVYISGPITGIPNLNRQAFDDAEKELTTQGHTTVNPLKVLPFHPTRTWTDYMRADITALMNCDTIYLLPGWENSRGARLELYIAQRLDFHILYAPHHTAV